MVHKKIYRKQFLAATILLIAVSIMLLPVKAQTDTILTFEPAQGNVALSGTTQITLNVIDGVDINAFDVSIEYDANLLSLASWSHGDYLSNLAVVKKVDEPGSFRLVCTQLATATVSGDGILLNLVFRGENLGSSAITITSADLAHSQGGLTHPSVIDGILTVRSESINTPTPTLTTQPTEMIYPIASSTPGNTPTKSPVLTYTPTRTLASNVATAIPSKTGDPITVTTPTAEVTFTETSVVQQPPTLTTEESEVDKVETAAQANPEPSSTLIVSDSFNAQPTPPGDNSESNTLFWVLLIAGVLLLVVLVFLVIRNKQKEKHKLIEY